MTCSDLMVTVFAMRAHVNVKSKKIFFILSKNVCNYDKV